MSSLLDPFKDINVEKVDESVQSLIECENQYCKLLREYQPEIDFILSKLVELREEELAFNERIHEIEQVLIKDDVDETARKKWIADLQNSMKLSFMMSNNLVRDFYVRKLDEFKSKAESLIKGG